MEAIGEALLDAGGLSRVRGLLYPVYPGACCIDGFGCVLQQRSGQSDSDTADSVIEHGVQDVEGRPARQKSIWHTTIPALMASTRRGLPSTLF